MKKLLTLTAVVAILPAPATAVQKCVALIDNNTIGTPYNSGTFGADWRVNFPNGNIVKGVATCSLWGYSDDGNLRDTISYAPEFDWSANYWCYCKMTKPAVSKWVLLQDYNDAADCFEMCAQGCEDWVARNQTNFRNLIFSAFE